MTSKEQCGDDRFEIINETKQYIINATNIETSPDEMNVLDSICFRLWQLGLTKRNKDKLKELTHQPTLSECIKEWEDRGFIVNNNELYIFLYHEQYGISMFINKKEIKYHVYHGYISLELNELLNKTLKALEAEKKYQII
jgi:hypothetical protein